MAAFREGRVMKVIERSDRIVRAEIEIGMDHVEAVGFPSMLGPLEPGDRVVANTTGVDLQLGTGGVAFLLWNLDGPDSLEPGAGHIIKMRYTPWQTEVLAVESPESVRHDDLVAVSSIDGMPVVACGLHSQIAGVAAGIKERRPDAVVGYIMTDGGALPLAWSRLVRSLQQEGLIDFTCTVGHAFGGDLEAVNVFSGLAAAHVVGGADVTIVGMGPGLAGTSTTLGFSGIEQGQVLDAATALGGRPVACLRVSFADSRPRHRGISHHTITALTIAAHTRATVAIPDLPQELSDTLWDQLRSHGISDRHVMVSAEGRPGMRLLETKGVDVTSMGIAMVDAPEGVLAAAAAGVVATEAISGAESV
ncbi:MAG: hypothetical protein QOD46_499 [Actinomycetota bacterium]|jgi:Protein of unknown function (DUF3866)|nr:hypothetical protein [Actinomycetota bacterium]